jgi:NADH dehydrogenase
MLGGCAIGSCSNSARVVIIGGGFGGLFATRELARTPISVTLIDKRNYHLFRPMLDQVASAVVRRPTRRQETARGVRHADCALGDEPFQED